MGPDVSDDKETAWNVGDLGSIPGSRRFPREGNGKPLQCSWMEKSMDIVTGVAVHGVEKIWTQLSD